MGGRHIIGKRYASLPYLSSTGMSVSVGIYPNVDNKLSKGVCYTFSGVCKYKALKDAEKHTFFCTAFIVV